MARNHHEMRVGNVEVPRSHFLVFSLLSNGIPIVSSIHERTHTVLQGPEGVVIFGGLRSVLAKSFPVRVGSCSRGLQVVGPGFFQNYLTGLILNNTRDKGLIFECPEADTEHDVKKPSPFQVAKEKPLRIVRPEGIQTCSDDGVGQAGVNQ
jgi:hypothetical protein